MAYDLEESQDYLRIKLPWPACLPHASCHTLLPCGVIAKRKKVLENRKQKTEFQTEKLLVIVFSICPDVRVSPATCV